MATEVKVPVLPESVSDATIAGWHKKAGDAVRRDENLVDLETDKVVLEVPSPVDGVLKEIKSSELLHNIPVVVLTSSTEPSDLLRAYDAGTNAYIAKPTEFSQFLGAMKHVCEFWVNINQTAPPLASSGVRSTGFGDLL